MTKIFIDTNIFLDMYRANLQSDISTLLGFIFKNKKYFITTEQSINEFTRNRVFFVLCQISKITKKL